MKTAKLIRKILISILILSLFPLVFILSYDGYNLYVDIYNYKQFKKVKEILELQENKDKDFYNLETFNKETNSDIKPIKNCYVISSKNGKYDYIFGFKYESELTKFVTGEEYFVYPEYDWPKYSICIMYQCYDYNMATFKGTIRKNCDNF